VIKRYIEKNDDCELVSSHTTRAPRAGEIDGIHYYFISTEEFKEAIKEGKFIGVFSLCERVIGFLLNVVFVLIRRI
jgi:guanylate kinase